MSDKILDCSKLGDYEFDAIKSGFDTFMNPRKPGPVYFGCVQKHDMKSMCRNFRYTDKRSFVKGGIVAAGLFWLWGKFKKHRDSKKEEPVEEFVPNEEES